MLAFIAVYLARNAGRILAYDYALDWAYAALALGLVVLAYLCNIGIWVGIASHYGASASWLVHARIWSTSRLGRYIPGKIATVYLRLEGYKSSQRTNAGMSLYIETASSLIAVCLFILAAALLGVVAIEPLHLVLIAIALGMLLVLTSSRFLRPVVARIPLLQRLSSPPATRPDAVLLAKAVALQAVVMTLHGASLLFAIRVFAWLDPWTLPELTVFYYFAGLLGMLALFAPAGIGVREAALTGMLQVLVPLPVAVLSVALVRLLTVCAELGLSGVFILLTRRSPESSTA